MAALGTLVPTALDSESGTTWTTTTVGNIDNTVAAPSGTFVVAGADSTSSIWYAFTDLPAAFTDGAMLTLNYNIRYKIETLAGDTETLFIRVWSAAGGTAYTNEETVASTTANISIVDKTSTSMTLTAAGLAATEAQWNAAVIEMRTTHTADHGADGSVWSIDEVELTGTYNGPPTVALNTPADSATGVSVTPDLLFTGTDADSDEIEYNVQVDTVNTFDSSNVDTYYFDVSDAGPTDSDASWTNDSNAFDGSTSTYANTNDLGSSIANELRGEGTNAPDSNSTISQVRMRSHGGVDGNYSWGTYGTLTVPTGGWTWAKVQALEVYAYGYTSFGDYFVLVHYLTDGEAEELGNRTAGGTSTTGTDFRLYRAEVEVTSTNLIDKLSVTPDATFAGTGDPHPWPSGNQITYTVQAADTLTASTVYYWRVAGTDPSGSNTYGAWATTRSFTTAAGGGATTFIDWPTFMKNGFMNPNIGTGV